MLAARAGVGDPQEHVVLVVSPELFAAPPGWISIDLQLEDRRRERLEIGPGVIQLGPGDSAVAVGVHWREDLRVKPRQRQQELETSALLRSYIDAAEPGGVR